MNLEKSFAPFTPVTTHLVDSLRYWAKNCPSEPAYYLTDGEQQKIKLTYKQLDRQARAIAVQLDSLNLHGERALLLYPPGLDYVAGLLGCLYAGAIAVPAYPPRRNRNMQRIQAIADDARAKAALTVHEVLDRMDSTFLDSAPHLKDLDWIATNRLPLEQADRWSMPDIRSDDLAVLQYTSGSTGEPKGVMLSHKNIMHNVALITQFFDSAREMIALSWLPSYHDMGLIGGFCKPLYMGRPSVLMSPMAFLQKPVRWLRAITEFEATVAGGPNFAYELCLQKIHPEHMEGLDLSKWKVAFNGAEPVRAETLKLFTERFAPIGFRQETHYPCYGMAESTLIVTGSVKADVPKICVFNGRELDSHHIVPVSEDDPTARSLVGCGRVLPDEDVVIVDPIDYARLPDDRVGEIWVSSPSVAQGYWRQSEATQQTFHAKLSDSMQGGPYLRTGDLGFLHEEHLFVTGRLKDLIIVRGVNRYPQDIERSVERASERLQAGAVGAFAVDVEGQERLIVVSEVERKRRKDWSDVIETIRRSVALEHELSPDGIVLVRFGSIPKTSSGKIQRHACRDCFLNDGLQVVAQWFAWHLDSKQSEPTQSDSAPASRGELLAADDQERQRSGDFAWAATDACYYFEPPVVRDSAHPVKVVAGDRAVISFTRPDFLALSADESVIESSRDAMQQFGVGGYRSADTVFHLEARSALADFVGMESAWLCGGFATALTGVANRLMTPHDLVLFPQDSPELGRWVTGTLGASREFSPQDLSSLDTILSESDDSYRQRWIVVESVSGMNGCPIDLPRLLALKREHRARLLLDQSFSVGTMGPHGRGLSEHYDEDPREIDVLTGTTGFALGTAGGYVAGSTDMIRQLSGSDVFARDGMSVPHAAALAASLRLLEDEPMRIARAQSRARLFLQMARQRRLDTGNSKASLVITLHVPVNESAVPIARQLLERGVEAEPLDVGNGDQASPRLRFFVTSVHAESDVRAAVTTTAEALGQSVPLSTAAARNGRSGIASARSRS